MELTNNESQVLIAHVKNVSLVDADNTTVVRAFDELPGTVSFIRAAGSIFATIVDEPKLLVLWHVKESAPLLILNNDAVFDEEIVDLSLVGGDKSNYTVLVTGNKSFYQVEFKSEKGAIDIVQETSDVLSTSKPIAVGVSGTEHLLLYQKDRKLNVGIRELNGRKRHEWIENEEAKRGASAKKDASSKKEAPEKRAESSEKKTTAQSSSKMISEAMEEERPKKATSKVAAAVEINLAELTANVEEAEKKLNRMEPSKIADVYSVLTTEFVNGNRSKGLQALLAFLLKNHQHSLLASRKALPVKTQKLSAIYRQALRTEESLIDTKSKLQLGLQILEERGRRERIVTMSGMKEESSSRKKTMSREASPKAQTASPKPKRR